MKRAPGVVTVLAALALGGCASLAADVTPPPDYRPPTVAPTAAPPAGPAGPANLAQGAGLYAERCAACHGPAGLSDGVQTAKLPQPPPPLGAPEVARAARPVDWYTTVTRGRMEKFMPAFAGLSEQQRWDVVAYALSLSVPPAQIERGRQRYAQDCQTCHGPQPDWAAPERLALRSDEELAQIIRQGRPPQMPAFAALTQDDLWALSAYLRSLGQTTTAATAAPSGGVTPSAAGSQIEVQGQLSGAGVPEPIPDGLQVTLRAFDGMQPAFERQTAVRSDGSYRFEQVELVPGRVLVTTIEYQGVTFNSDILHGDQLAAGQPAQLPITVFPVSNDAGLLRADRMHIFFEFTSPTTVQVVELFIISNPTTQVVAPAAADRPALTFVLPEGAGDLQFQDGSLGERFVQTPGGFGEMQPILPGQGQHQILFAYSMPYNDGLNLTLTLPLAVDAAVAMLPAGGVSLSSPQLQPTGTRTVQDVQFQLYVANPQAAGSQLELALSGSALPGGASLSTGSGVTLAAGLGAFILALALVGWWYYRQRNQQAAEDAAPDTTDDLPAGRDELLDAILALDDRHAAGELPEAAYQQRRQALKERLSAVLAAETAKTGE